MLKWQCVFLNPSNNLKNLILRPKVKKKKKKGKYPLVFIFGDMFKNEFNFL